MTQLNGALHIHVPITGIHIDDSINILNEISTTRIELAQVESQLKNEVNEIERIELTISIYSLNAQIYMLRALHSQLAIDKLKNERGF